MEWIFYITMVDGIVVFIIIIIIINKSYQICTDSKKQLLQAFVGLGSLIGATQYSGKEMENYYTNWQYCRTLLGGIK